VAVPEAIYAIHDSIHERSDHLSAHDYEAIGAGPGWGVGQEQEALLNELFSRDQPMVLDADALNTIAQFPDLLMSVPAGSILTPHPKEFDRIFGTCRDEFDRLRIARDQARNLHLNILLKGHRSFLISPDGKVHVNSTGNPGMATAGSGDVLTGLLTGLLAQGMTPTAVMILGAWLHGRAGDLAALETGEEALVAGDLPGHIGRAYLSLKY
jgi:NAD(P)H-hydrate epimerase